MIERVAVEAIKTYKKIATPYVIKSCRFAPTCSEYAIEAIEQKGIARGTMLSIWRLLRCNPFSRGGWDPVKKEKAE